MYLFHPVLLCTPERMDQKEKREACEILRKEFSKSGRYCNWRSGDDFKCSEFVSVSEENLVYRKKSVDVKKSDFKNKYSFISQNSLTLQNDSCYSSMDDGKFELENI